MFIRKEIMKILLAVQSISNDFFDILFQIITFLAEDIPILAVIAVIYWCRSRRTGIKLALYLFTSLGINNFIKNLVRIPRPNVLYKDSGLRFIRQETATGYSFPSGHTQTASTLYFSLYREYGGKPLLALSVVVTLAVAFSRMYLGAHTLFDTLGAVIFSLICVFVLGIVIDKIYEKIDKEKKYSYCFLFVIPLVLSVSSLFAFWNANPPIYEDTLKIFGFGIAFITGMFINEKYFPFDAQCGKNGKLPLTKQILKVIIGLSGAAVIKIFFELFGDGVLVSAIQYFFIGFWLTAVMSFIIYKFFNKKTEV